MNQVLDNSVWIIGFVTLFALLIRECLRYKKERGMSNKDVILHVRRKLNIGLNRVLTKLVSSAGIACIISLVSFRELWLPDVFHVVFVASLMYRPVESYIKGVLK